MSAPPPPIKRPRTDYAFAWILLGVMLVAGVLVFTGIYVFSRYIMKQVSFDIRESASGGDVAVETPAGSLRVRTGEATEAEIGLPLYPRAVRRESEAGSISLEVPASKAVRVVAAEYETPDSLDKVIEYYRRELGAAARESRLGPVVQFETGGEERHKRVALRRSGNLTRITLASITEAGAN